MGTPPNDRHVSREKLQSIRTIEQTKNMFRKYENRSYWKNLETIRNSAEENGARGMGGGSKAMDCSYISFLIEVLVLFHVFLNGDIGQAGNVSGRYCLPGTHER